MTERADVERSADNEINVCMLSQGVCTGPTPRAASLLNGGTHRQAVESEVREVCPVERDGTSPRARVYQILNVGFWRQSQTLTASGFIFSLRSAAMAWPWKRPFSMKISLVRIPATMTPAR